MNDSIKKLRNSLTRISLQIDELRVMLNCVIKLMTFINHDLETKIYDLGKLLTQEEENEK